MELTILVLELGSAIPLCSLFADFYNKHFVVSGTEPEDIMHRHTYTHSDHPFLIHEKLRLCRNEVGRGG